MQSHNFPRGSNPRTAAKTPRHQFPLGSPALLLFLFHETTTVLRDTRVCHLFRGLNKQKINK